MERVKRLGGMGRRKGGRGSKRTNGLGAAVTPPTPRCRYAPTWRAHGLPQAAGTSEPGNCSANGHAKSGGGGVVVRRPRSCVPPSKRQASKHPVQQDSRVCGRLLRIVAQDLTIVRLVPTVRPGRFPPRQFPPTRLSQAKPNVGRSNTATDHIRADLVVRPTAQVQPLYTSSDTRPSLSWRR